MISEWEARALKTFDEFMICEVSRYEKLSWMPH